MRSYFRKMSRVNVKGFKSSRESLGGRKNTIIYYSDKLQLSRLVNLSFKLTDIICVIHGNFFFSLFSFNNVHIFSKLRFHGGLMEGEGRHLLYGRVAKRMKRDPADLSSLQARSISRINSFKYGIHQHTHIQNTSVNCQNSSVLFMPCCQI